MSKASETATPHPGEKLSGYLDGELTQGERQWVELHCEDCADCRNQLEELRSLSARIGGARISVIGEDRWRETMDNTTVKVGRGIGWLLFLAGLLVICGYVLYQFGIDAGIPTWVKFAIAAVYGGLFVLLLSVLRQRLIESKTDKYKNVEI